MTTAGHRRAPAYRRANQTVRLADLDRHRVGRNMMLRDSTHANTSLTFEKYYSGFTLPILDGASGKLSMAFAADEDREMILRWTR